MGCGESKQANTKTKQENKEETKETKEEQKKDDLDEIEQAFRMHIYSASTNNNTLFCFFDCPIQKWLYLLV